MNTGILCLLAILRLNIMDVRSLLGYISSKVSVTSEI